MIDSKCNTLWGNHFKMFMKDFSVIFPQLECTFKANLVFLHSEECWGEKGKTTARFWDDQMWPKKYTDMTNDVRSNLTNQPRITLPRVSVSRYSYPWDDHYYLVFYVSFDPSTPR